MKKITVKNITIEEYGIWRMISILLITVSIIVAQLSTVVIVGTEIEMHLDKYDTSVFQGIFILGVFSLSYSYVIKDKQNNDPT